MIALNITESLLSLLDTTCIVVTCVAGNNRPGHAQGIAKMKQSLKASIDGKYSIVCR